MGSEGYNPYWWQGGLLSGGHERKFLSEAGNTFSLSHEEERFSQLGTEAMFEACEDLALKIFIALTSRLAALEQELASKKAQATALALEKERAVDEAAKLREGMNGLCDELDAQRQAAGSCEAFR